MNGKTIFTQLGTVATAGLATACCWIPLMIAVTGITAAGIGTQLEQYSTFFYLLTAVLLLYSFWEGFLRPQPSCEPCESDEGVEQTSSGSTRSGQARLFFALHLVLVAVLLALPTIMASTPLAVASTQDAPEVALADASTVDVSIQGMTCAGCVTTIERSVAELDGVYNASVSFDEARATLHFDTDLVGVDDLVEHIAADGYEVAIIED